MTAVSLILDVIVLDAQGAGGEEMEHIKKKRGSKAMVVYRRNDYIRIPPKFANYLLEYILLIYTKYVDIPPINVIYIKILIRYS